MNNNTIQKIDQKKSDVNSQCDVNNVFDSRNNFSAVKIKNNTKQYNSTAAAEVDIMIKQ